MPRLTRTATSSNSEHSNKKQKTKETKYETPTPPPYLKCTISPEGFDLNSDTSLYVQVVQYLDQKYPIDNTGKAITTIGKNTCGNIQEYDVCLHFPKDEHLLRLLSISVFPGIEKLHNLAVVDPNILTVSDKYLVHLEDLEAPATTFFMTAIVLESNLITSPKHRTGHQVIVQPFDITWQRIINTLTSAIEYSKIFIYSFAEGIPISTYGTIKKGDEKDNHDDRATSIKKRNFPVRAPDTVLVIDGNESFRLKYLRSVSLSEQLPRSKKELPPYTPVLVTFTVAINDWEPKSDTKNDKIGPKSPMKKWKEGFNKSVSFNLQNIVELGPPAKSYEEIIDSMDEAREDDVFL